MGDGRPDDNEESSSSDHTDISRFRCFELKGRGFDFLECIRYCRATRADAVGVKEPLAVCASACRVTKAASAFTNPSVILDCAEDTDVSETVRPKCRGRERGKPEDQGP